MSLTQAHAIARDINEGRVLQALTQLAAALLDDPVNVDLLRLKGMAFHRLGDGDKALEAYQSSLKVDPNNIFTLLGYADLLRDANAGQAAVDQYQRVLKMSPTHPKALAGIAAVLIKVKDLARATDFLRQAAQAAPQEVQYTRQLAECLVSLGRYHEAEQPLRQLLALEPDNQDLAFLLGDVLLKCENVEQAKAAYARVQTGKLYDQARMREVNCMLRQELVPDAIEAVDTLLEQGNACRAELLSLKAAALIFIGRQEDALVANTEALKADKNLIQAWQNQVGLAPDKFTQADIAHLELLSKQGENYVRMAAKFVLADLWEARRDYQRQMSLLEAGNAIAARLTPYDKASMRQLEQAMRDWHLRHRDLPLVSGADDAFTPVFVLGLPRSGTTLLEQVLSGHSKVDASGESLALLHALNGSSLESLMAQPESAWVPDFRQRYIDYQRNRGFDAPLVVDKAIFHFRIAGLLRRAFPHARFIAIHRQPLDLCLGGWKKLFTTALQWVYTPEGLAHSIKQFQTLTELWSQDPAMRLYQLDYEALVGDTEAQVQGLCQHLGIDMEAAMLTPEQQQRAVITASTSQVREALNTGYVSRWKRYDGLLAPFIDALTKQGVSID